MTDKTPKTEEAPKDVAPAIPTPPTQLLLEPQLAMRLLKYVRYPTLSVAVGDIPEWQQTCQILEAVIQGRIEQAPAIKAAPVAEEGKTDAKEAAPDKSDKPGVNPVGDTAGPAKVNG